MNVKIAETFSRQLMYDMYIRVVILGVLSRHSSIYRTFTKRAVANSDDHCSSAPKSRTTCTFGFVSDGRFLVLRLFF